MLLEKDIHVPVELWCMGSVLRLVCCCPAPPPQEIIRSDLITLQCLSQSHRLPGKHAAQSQCRLASLFGLGLFHKK